MNRGPTILRSLYLFLLVPLLCAGACGSNPDSSDPGIPDWDGGFEAPNPVLPELAPCPDGWEAQPPAEPSGVVVCEPWPDGDPAAPPVLTPCPAGWREVTDAESGVVTCDPWPEGGRQECTAVDEAHFPGEPGCSRIGPACPAGEWAEDLPTDAPLLYVSAAAAPDGTGTIDAPFATIDAATAVAETGTVIALGKGTYDEEVRLPSDTTLWGACVAETIVTCSEPSEQVSTIRAIGRDIAVRNVQVGGDRYGVSVSSFGRSLDIENVLVLNAAFAGVGAWQGNLTGRNVIVRSTNPRPGHDDFGFGIVAESEGQIDLQRVAVEENLIGGISVNGERTAVRITDAVIADTQGMAGSQLHGHGLTVFDQGTAELERVVISNNRSVGAGVTEAGSTLTLRDVVIQDTMGQASDHMNGWGLSAAEGGHAVVERALLEGNRHAGIGVAESGSRLDLTDAVIRDTGPQERDSDGGRGLNVEGGSSAHVARAIFERNYEIGVTVSGAESAMVLTDVVVRDTRSLETDGDLGRGLQAQLGASVEVTRGVFEGNRDVGIAIQTEGTVGTLTDVVVRDTESREDTLYNGRGITVSDGAEATVWRALLENNRELGFDIYGDHTEVMLEDIVVRDTQCNEAELRHGLGLYARRSATVEVRRALFERNRALCIHASGFGTSLALSDIVVRDTASGELYGDAGRGLNAQYGAQVSVESAVFERNREAGVLAIDPGTYISLTNVIIDETADCACAATTCPNVCAGVGVISLGEADIDMEVFRVTNNAMCGLQLTFGLQLDDVTTYDAIGTMDLSRGRISDHLVCGVNLRDAEYDLSRLTDRVVYLDNNQNLSTDNLPVPTNVDDLDPE